MLIKKGTISFEYVKISDLLGTTYHFPIFQRFYAWKEKHINDLLNDIDLALDNSEKEIYLLDFIWYEDDGKAYIADGQQRIVTLNLLFLIINDLIRRGHLDVGEIPLFNLKYDWPDYDAKYQSALETIRTPFRQVYFALSNKLKSYTTQEIKTIRDILMDRTYVYMRKVEDVDTAFTIFSTINTGGKPLTKDEIVKTTIDQYSKTYGICVDYNIKKPKTLTKSLQGYFKNLRPSNEQFDVVNIVDFLSKDVIKDRETFQRFANYINIVKGLETTSIYKVIEYIGRPQLHNILEVMAYKGIDPENDRNYVQKAIMPLCLLSVVMSMNRANPGGAIKGFYDQIIQRIKSDYTIDTLQKYMIDFIGANKDMCTISYDDFVDALGGNSIIRKKVKEGILVMDVIRCNVSGNINMNKINLEHIYPENPHIEWAKHAWPTSKEETTELNSNIGNMMLLNEEINKVIKNKYITVKRPYYEKMINRDKTLQNDMNIVNYERFENEKGSYIVERQKEIAKIIYEDFELAQVMIKKSN